MTQYENVSVHEYTSGPKEGERFLKFGKGEASGSDIHLATPNNDVDAMAKMERERVLVWSLPEPMSPRRGALHGAKATGGKRSRAAGFDSRSGH